MNTDIKYNGYTAQPSDYESPDGDLALSLNLINEDSHLNPIPQPGHVLTLQDGERLLFIHDVSAGKQNYILERKAAGGRSQIYWQEVNNNVADTSNASPLITLAAVSDVVAIGNTLAIATESGLTYALWKDGTYKHLGAKPPFISIDFGMKHMGEVTRTEKFAIPSRCAPPASGAGASGSPGRNTAAKEEMAEFTQMAYSLINPAASGLSAGGYFHQPFFVRYAYRLYDGSHWWHSAPVLMLPNIMPPVIEYTDTDEGKNDSNGTVDATLYLRMPSFQLTYRILTDGIDNLADWSDLIAGIDVFVSAPLYTYDQSKDLTWRPTVKYNSFLQANAIGATTTDGAVFVGHYAQDAAYVTDSYVDHFATGSRDVTVLNIRRHEKFSENIRNASLFYKLCEIDTPNIAPMETMQPLKFKDSDLTALTSRQTLSDDYRSHCGISAKSLCAFNSRLNLAGVSLMPAEPFPIRSCMQFGNPEGLMAHSVKITVWSRINGVKTVAVHHDPSNKGADRWYNPAANFPRYIFYPDASAYKMEIFVSDSQKYTFNLTPHEHLNGAYYFRWPDSLGADPTPETAESETDECVTAVNLGSKIYTSEVNNPFVFPATGINTVGTGAVIALSSAAKALSQGQFGQFPLYAFTSEGVWALETAANGSYVARQPITRDVCLGVDSVCQLDSAVLFATARGIMMLSGSTSKCISDSINNGSQIDLTQLPALSRFLPDGVSSIAPFRDFLAESRMLYDYVHQRIVVFNPSTDLAYVFSMRSGLWGMMQSNLASTVNSYPEALAVTRDNRLVNFAETPNGAEAAQTEDTPRAVLVTRPLKLSGPDLLKTVDTVIQRGDFRRGHVQSVLYGSRDLRSWHLVWSSTSHTLRGFRGTPYKYFRIALLANLDRDESITGASVQFAPRLTDKPR